MRRAQAVKSDTLTLLELEHERLGELLGVLESELDDMERGRPYHHGLIGLSLEYLLDYPDACHHPKEDLIAARLELAADAATGSDLQFDHQRLHDFTQRVADEFRSVEVEGAGAIAFATLLRGFIETYRGHIASENGHFFPTARRTLTQDDFDAIDFSVFDRPDPIVNVEDKQRFAVLRQSIFASREEA